MEVISAGRATRLRKPTVGEWARWLDEQGRGDYVDRIAAMGVMLGTLGAPPPDPTEALAYADPDLPHRLLSFWRDHPISPWVSGTAAKGREVLRSTQPGARGALSLLYRALPNLPPQVIDSMELWQVAARLGVDRGEDRRASSYVDAAGETHLLHRSWRRKPDEPLRYQGSGVRDHERV